MQGVVKPLLLVLALVLPWLNPVVWGPVNASIQTFITLFCAIWVVLLVSQTADWAGRRFARLLAVSWLLAAAVSAVFGLLQFFGHSALLGALVDVAAPGEAYGNLRQRNQYATLLNVGQAALLWWQMAPRVRWPAGLRSRLGQGWQFALSGVLVVLLASATAASSSRTGLFQVVLVAALALYWQWRSPQHHVVRLRVRWLVLLLLVSYALMVVVLPLLAGQDPASVGAWSRLRAGDSTCSSRRILWSNVLDLIALKPWTGWGAGELAYAHFNTLYDGPRFCEILDNAHNLPLHIAVLWGVPAAVVFCLALVVAVVLGKPWRAQRPNRQLAWSVWALIGLHSLLEYPLWYAPFQLAVLAAVLLWCRAPRRQAWFSSDWTQLLAGLVFALGAYSVWDYWRISQVYLPVEERAPAYKDGTLEKIQGSWLYHGQVRFAELSVLPLTPDNAAYMLDLSKELLHFSPEPMVLERLMDSATLLGRTDDLDYYGRRFRVAYPDAYAHWLAEQ